MSRISLIFALLFILFGQHLANEDDKDNSATSDQYEDDSEKNESGIKQIAVGRFSGFSEEEEPKIEFDRALSSGRGCPENQVRVKKRCKKIIKSQ